MDGEIAKRINERERGRLLVFSSFTLCSFRLSPATDKLDRPHSLIPFSYSLNLSSLSARGSGGRRGGATTSNQSPHYSWQNGANNLLIPLFAGLGQNWKDGIDWLWGGGEQHGASASPEDSEPSSSTAAPPLRALGERQTERERDRKWGRETSKEKRERSKSWERERGNNRTRQKKCSNWGKNKDGETKGGWGKCRKMQKRQPENGQKINRDRKGRKKKKSIINAAPVALNRPDCFTE